MNSDFGPSLDDMLGSPKAAPEQRSMLGIVTPMVRALAEVDAQIDTQAQDRTHRIGQPKSLPEFFAEPQDRMKKEIEESRMCKTTLAMELPKIKPAPSIALNRLAEEERRAQAEALSEVRIEKFVEAVRPVDPLEQTEEFKQFAVDHLGEVVEPLTEVPDYGDDANIGKPTFEEVFPRLQAMVREAIRFEQDIAAKEEALKITKAQLAGIVEKTLPDMMKSAGVEDFKTTDGLKIKLKKDLRAHISEANKAEAWQWLKDNGHGDILKREVAVNFGIASEKRAGELVRSLQAQGLDTKLEIWAEVPTVKKIIRERIEALKPVPMELFGAKELTVATFTAPKK